MGYPLWDAAREVWAKDQPSEQTFCDELTGVGFACVRVSLCKYPCQVSVDKWCELIRGRFWSTFHGFTDEELVAATEEIRLKSSGSDLFFDERLLLISAVNEG